MKAARLLALINALLLVSAAHATVVSYLFEGGFGSVNTDKSGIFAIGPDVVYGSFTFDTSEWYAADRSLQGVEYFEAVAPTITNINIVYDGISYSCNTNPTRINRITLVNDWGAGLRDEFEFISLKPVGSNLSDLLMIEFRSLNKAPLESLDLPNTFNLSMWDLSTVGRLQRVNDDGSLAGNLQFDITSLTPVPIPSNCWLIFSSFLGIAMLRKRRPTNIHAFDCSVSKQRKLFVQ